MKSCILHSIAEDLQDVSLMARIEGGYLIVLELSQNIIGQASQSVQTDEGNSVFK